MNERTDEMVITELAVTPSPLLFWLKINLRLSEKSISGRQPNNILGLIPAGYSKISYPLKQIATVQVETKVSLPKIIFGLILVFFGISIFGSQLLFGFAFILGGAAIFMAGLTAALALTSTGGNVTRVLVSLLDKSKIEEFSSAAQRAILDVN